MGGSENQGSTTWALRPGEWWLGISCPCCSELLALLPEVTADVALAPAKGRLKTTCPACQRTFLFESKYLLRLQIPDDDAAAV